ncbi:MAG: YbaB/EbfC family nucleoid-associated protein [Candidatus Faecenecus gallistercoris]|nr:YbaB/EbfC family nucleoid-associated protein [Bacillota bacterium]MDD7102833.1 YbaB/EbfC family nucleoid-associated protein [Bacillota bacterium]MDY4051439.1 YbaB/EbfC family nucleoid-associated protein [Candidatus Faecenecus gallistercoris]PWL72625.1 MAG: nucleoid-associated protein, YbaB/EbfC family [Bacillota bacterium]
MNLQAIMKQAQAMQKDITKAKKEIDEMKFTVTQSFVTVTLRGDRTVEKVEIDSDAELGKDDIEMLQDMIVVAINQAMKEIDKVTEQKLGKYSNAMQGLL